MIAIGSLEPDDVSLIGACLDAVVKGPFFPDWEFGTLFGLSRDDVRAVAKAWPQNAAEPDTELAVRNTFANLFGYPHGQERELEEMVSASAERMREVWDRIKSHD